MNIRPESTPAQVDSGVKIIRVKESGGSIYRMKWNGSAYAIVAPAITVYEDSTTPATLDAGEEAVAIWRPPAQRYEIIKGATGDPGEGGESLFAKFTATAYSSRATDTITGDIDEYWGGTPAGTTGVTVNKLSDHDVTVYSGDQFIGVWNTTANQWDLLYFDGLRITIQGTVSNSGSDVTPSTSTFSLTSPALVNGWRLPASTVTVTNDPPLYVAEGTTIKARFNLTLGSNPLTSWDTGDAGNFLHLLKGIGGYNAGGSIQFVAVETTDDPQWVTPDSHDGGELQVVGHADGGTDLDWITAEYIEIDLT